MSRWSEHEEISTFQVSWDGIFYFRDSRCAISATFRLDRWGLPFGPAHFFVKSEGHGMLVDSSGR